MSKNMTSCNAGKYYLLAAKHGVSTGIANFAGDLLFYNNDAAGAASLLEKNTKVFPLDQHLWLILAASYQRLGNQKAALDAAERAYKLGVNSQSAYVYNQILNNQPVDLQ